MTYLAVGLLAALLSFGFIVFIHELGHFLAARWAGIRCPQFAIGFGPKLFAFPWLGSEFSLRLFPIGGYVLMVGEDPALEAAEGGNSWHSQFVQCVGEVNFPTTAASVRQNIALRDPVVEAFLDTLPPQRVYHNMEDLEGNFNAKTAWQRTVVILGGVFMNFLCAALLLIGLGLTVGIGYVDYDSQARAQEVFKGGPAALAGLRNGDNLLKVDGISILNGDDFKAQMSGKVGQTVTLSVQAPRSQPRTVKLVPDMMMGDDAYQFHQGQQVELVGSPAKKVPAHLKLPYVVHSVNGKPLKDLVELRAWGQNARELTLDGPQGPLKIESSPNFHPRAVVGIRLARVTVIGFEGKATSEVLEVKPGSQAARAGVKPGDRLVALQGVIVDSGKTRLDGCLADLSQRPPSQVDSLKLTVWRDDKPKDLVMNEIPQANSEAWGVRLQPVNAPEVLRQTGSLLKNIALVPVKIIQGLMHDRDDTVKSLKEETTGPIGIMQQIFEVTDEGLPSLLFLVAILNAFIATFNLLPIPALDGSRCLFIWLGALRGRALNPEKEARIHFIGIIVLLTVVALVSYGDVTRLFRGDHILK